MRDRTVANHFFDREHEPVLKACCGRKEDRKKLDKFAKNWKYELVETDWRKIAVRDAHGWQA